MSKGSLLYSLGAAELKVCNLTFEEYGGNMMPDMAHRVLYLHWVALHTVILSSMVEDCWSKFDV